MLASQHIHNFGSLFTTSSVNVTGRCCTRFRHRRTRHNKRPLGVTLVCDFTPGRTSPNRRNFVSSRSFRATNLSRSSQSFLSTTVYSCGQVFNDDFDATSSRFRGCCGSLYLELGGHSLSVTVIIGVLLANFSTAALGAL